jgi:hypothetical protein
MERDWGGLFAEEDFGGEATDGDVSAADGVKEGGVIWRGGQGVGNIGGERSVFKVGDGRDGRVDGEGRDKWGREVYVGRVIRELRGGRGWYVESPHILARLQPTRTGVESPGTKMESMVA